MSPFELTFAVYGLLLGLAIADVLSGFSGALKLKRGAKAVRIGWLTPLLGLFVILDLTGFWLLAWYSRDQIQANYLTLVVVLSIVGLYFLAASLIFPDDPEDWPDFDDWYDKQNRLVYIGLLTANVMSWIGQIILEEMKPTPGLEDKPLTYWEVVSLWTGLGIVALLISLMFVKNRRLNVAMLALLIVLILVSGVTEEL